MKLGYEQSEYHKTAKSLIPKLVEISELYIKTKHPSIDERKIFEVMMNSFVASASVLIAVVVEKKLWNYAADKIADQIKDILEDCKEEK